MRVAEYLRGVTVLADKEAAIKICRVLMPAAPGMAAASIALTKRTHACGDSRGIIASTKTKGQTIKQS